MNPADLKELILEEGLRLFVYDDATGLPIRPGTHVIGHPSVGIGRALDVHGISSTEAAFLIEDDITAINNALGKFPWWVRLDPVRAFIITDMALNMGVVGMLAFKAMIAALERNDHETAAAEMLKSKWALQVPSRAKRLSDAMRAGHFPA